MIGAYVLLFLYSTIACIEASLDRKITFEDRTVIIIPHPGKTHSETVWKLKSPKNTKIISECSFNTRNIQKAKIRIDTGIEIGYHNPGIHTIFRNVSEKNYMRITFDNFGPVPLSSCRIRATKPYIDMTVPKIDSSEFGKSRAAMEKLTKCKCGWANKGRKRIIGGEETGVNEFPFVTSLKNKKCGTHFCGGTIITRRHVLTAAHCLEKFKNVDITVVVGEHNFMTSTETTAKEEIDVLEVIIHEGYSQDIDEDIALLVLIREIAFTIRVGPVCMPSLFLQTLPGTVVTGIGWGMTKDVEKEKQLSNVLRKVNLNIIDSVNCEIIYETDTYNHLCMYNAHKDVCNGDSGGPIVHVDPETNMYVLVGVVSFGHKCASTYPTVSTNVEQYLDWIKWKIEETVPAEMCP